MPHRSDTSSELFKWATGLFYILLVTIIWTGASYLTQFLYVDLNFHSPFVLTYLCSSFFSVYLLSWQVLVRLGWINDVPRYVCTVLYILILSRVITQFNFIPRNPLMNLLKHFWFSSVIQGLLEISFIVKWYKYR